MACIILLFILYRINEKFFTYKTSPYDYNNSHSYKIKTFNIVIMLLLLTLLYVRTLNYL